MYGERDVLIKNVFSALNVKAKSKNLNLVPVDLRWGLTKEESNSQIEVCIKQMEKCSIVLSMLGSRFGWVPPDYQVNNNANGNKAISEWLSSIPPGESITSLEIQYALSQSSQKHCLALFRDPTFQSTVPILHQSSFNSESEECQEKLARLKNLVKSHPHCTVFENYSCKYGGTDKEGKPFVTDLDEYSKLVFDYLWEVIETEFPTPVQLPDQFQHELLVHENFLNLKVNSYFGRESIQKKLTGHLMDKSSIDNIAVLYGEPGSGKTSSLAYFAKTMQKQKDWFVLYHFVGCSSESIDVGNILSKFSTILNKSLNLNFEIPTTLEKLRIEFPKILNKAGHKKKILVIIDDLDEISTANQSHQMEWLPESSDLRNNIFIVLSCDQGKKCWDYLHLRTQIPQTIYLTPLEMSDRSLIATEILKIYGKKLESKLMDKLVSKTHAKFPLFIKLACEELRVFGAFDRLQFFINKIPETIGQLILLMLNRIESDLGGELVKNALTYIGLSRFGLEESELLSLLKDVSTSKTSIKRFTSNKTLDTSSNESLPFSIWAPLLNTISPLLRGYNNSNTSLAFFHGEITKVILNHYLPTEKQTLLAQNSLAQYYQSISDPTGDKKWLGTKQLKGFLELPYHLMKSKRWDLLSALFLDLQFIETKFQIGLGRDLIDNFLSSINEITSPILSGEQWKGNNFTNVNNVIDFYAFIQYQAHHLERFPIVTSQQALCLPDSSICHQISQKELEKSKRLHFKWVNKSQVSDYIISTLSGHEDFIRCVLYKDDGSLIASCSDDQSIRIWNGETGSLVRVFPKVHTDKITQLIWRGNTIVTVSRDKRIIMWDEYGKMLAQFIDGHKLPVWGVTVSGDLKRIATASWDNTCIVWDVESKSKVFTFTAHKNKLSACAYSNNNKYIATGCWDGVLIIWDATTGLEVKRIQISPFTILFLQFSQDDQMLLVSSVDTFTHVFNTSTWNKLAKLEGHIEAVISSRFSRDGKYIVSCSDDKTIRVYETTEWTQVSMMTGHSGRIISVAFHPSSSNKIISGATDKFIKIWDPKIGYSFKEEQQGHRRSVTCLRYSHDTIYSASDDGTFKTFSSKNDLLSLQSTLKESIQQFYIQPGGQLFIYLGSKGSLQMEQPKKQLLHQQINYISMPSVSNKTLLAFSSKTGMVGIIDAITLVQYYRNEKLLPSITEVCFNENGEYLACSDNKSQVAILHRSADQSKYTVQQFITMSNPEVAVTGITWSSQYLALGTFDGSTYIYDIKKQFKPVITLKGHRFAVHALRFTPDSKYIFTASLDKYSIFIY
eukprot:gene7523-9246_t